MSSINLSNDPLVFIDGIRMDGGSGNNAANVGGQSASRLNDIKLEAAAFLCLARQVHRVDLGFARRVIAFRNADGGWGRPVEGAGNPEGSSWHSTILALMILLHVRFPAADAGRATRSNA